MKSLNNQKIIEYYDAFGLPPPIEVMKRVKGEVFYSTKQIQDIHGTTCGFFCIGAILADKGYGLSEKKLAKYLKMFNKDTTKNDKILEKFLNDKLKQIKVGRGNKPPKPSRVYVEPPQIQMAVPVNSASTTALNQLGIPTTTNISYVVGPPPITQEEIADQRRRMILSEQIRNEIRTYNIQIQQLNATIGEQREIFFNPMSTAGQVAKCEKEIKRCYDKIKNINDFIRELEGRLRSVESGIVRVVNARV
jgi:hypothetical protein